MDPYTAQDDPSITYVKEMFDPPAGVPVPADAKPPVLVPPQTLGPERQPASLLGAPPTASLEALVLNGSGDSGDSESDDNYVTRP